MTTESTGAATRRRLLQMLGLGAAGTAAAGIVASDGVFAKHFIGSRAELKVPEMVYDPEQQVMIDPVTRRPIHERGKKIQVATAIVTAGCRDCPKNDGCSDTYAC
jgi:hypothetical protein